jgi:hypothetical protein
LDNGIQIWTKAYPGPSVVCRIIAKHPHTGAVQIFPMDPPAEAFEDELIDLIEDCKERLGAEEEYEIGVVVVGPIDQERLRPYLKEACQLFAPRTPPSNRRALEIGQTEKVEVRIDYPHALPDLTTDQAIKKMWVTHLVQTMVQERVRKTVFEAGGEWVIPKELKSLLPATCTTFHYRHPSDQEPTHLLAKCLEAFQEIKKSGFSDVELFSAKALLQKKLSFFSKPLTHLLLADYLAALMGKGAPAYTLFMSLSEKMLKEAIEMPQVIEMLGSDFKDRDRKVFLTAPFVLNFKEEELLSFVGQYLADAIVFSAPQGGQNSFTQLPLNPEEEKLIYDLVYEVGNAGWGTLWLDKAKLLQIGKDIHHVHPLRFLGVVYSHPPLKEAMKKIFSDIVKFRSFFLGSQGQTGFSDKMDREHERKNLKPHLWGFSQLVQKHPDQLEPFIEHKDWIGLVECIVDIK